MKWKQIKNYEGLYFVSDTGEIKNAKGNIMRHWSNGKGYRYLTFMKNGIRQNVYVHRMVGIAFLKPDPERRDINHRNGIKSDNRLENLEWCNKFENMRHAYDNKLLVNPNAKLSELEVNIIRKMWSAGIHRDKIAEVFNVSFAQICRIVNYKNWNGKP